ncbi:mannitol dehydrogenase family protein [Microvirga terrestris]|uniref:Mannitol dehydrogenase family protein n=1 Tax=Microvirga terrestris TaxID=2791024 RepID=A0ABS0HND7_9HYPH|nr:mannitol dehydrogenase family protein [Microvirga terrestris]MBF9194993.1 mannitol dehydrogenase family protein [Microvirga terrestris]
MSDRLNDDTLLELARDVRRPAYDRRTLKTGIVHLGVGAFHRAHQAVYTDDVLAQDPRWGIVAASLRSPDTYDALQPQDGLYTLSVRSREGEALRVVGSIRRVIVAPSEIEDLLNVMAAPQTRIVTLTVTEKGYCHDPATGALNEAHPDIVHDLAYSMNPKSAPGFIVEALRRRRMNGVPPFTVLTCDNLPSNGRTVKRVLTRFAELVDPELGRFVADEVSCPSTMVDRIVPATSDQDRERIGEALGLTDAWPVVTEPFTQWVIEDSFPHGRPAWEKAGAEFVSDVEPYEHMKLRLLNGSHSTLAYLGYLAGYETVADTMSDEAFVRLIRGLMDEEVTPTLHMPQGADLESYKGALIERFKNPALKHRTWQIAMDGSQKLPQRLLGTIRDRLSSHAPIGRLSLGVAAWMRYVAGTDEKGTPIDIRDPMAARLREVANGAGRSGENLAHGLFAIREIFGDDLPADPRFTGVVVSHLMRLYEIGAKRTVSEFKVG